MTDCEVLIVGAGPSGLVLACLLAQEGVDVAVVDRRSQPRGYSRAIGLHPPALAVLELIGLEGAVRAEGLHVRSGVARSRGRTLGSLSFEKAWPERPFVLTLPQNRTEALLRGRLAQVAPEALRLGWEITDLTEEDDGVTAAAIASPDRHPAPGPKPSRAWRARVLVGADGPRSTVRRHGGIGTRTREMPDTYLMGDFPALTGPSPPSDAAASSTAVVHLEPGGVVEAFPLPGGSRRWVAHTGTRLVEPSAALLSRIVGDRTGEHLDPASATMASAFSVRRRIAERMVRGRSVLIGDAAHELSPIGGQGMTLGWLDTAQLAPLILRALTHGGPLDRSRGIEEFEQDRLRSARRAARQAELNTMLGRPMGMPAAAAREVLLRGMLGTPARLALARAFTMRGSSPPGLPPSRATGRSHHGRGDALRSS
ncbi:2-polyprenyl-6-methoxyphenol hydroxylase [Brevibacterium jeotgali]|uniref:2-polyprenyl-6-methoxyphenol hydroxylase n=1 Tax=Brevibacterium jeotgali TaxID=1262550 RepID=A0A2H1L314_9MICO|nr:2-polyprenyl-6-methoxyphenol hydroxylase-like FAD-dependent oxidoreductase [Brevibacterium jeotgali]SMY11294.1 2-polyprenyl-6-methoxyphenol hydroxylase [Brevibacterium jeotgali]